MTVERDRPNPMSSETRVGKAVRLKRLRAPVSTCPFQLHCVIFRKSEVHPPASESSPFEMKGRPEVTKDDNFSSGKVEYAESPPFETKERPEVTKDDNSRVATILDTSTFPLL